MDPDLAGSLPMGLRPVSSVKPVRPMVSSITPKRMSQSPSNMARCSRPRGREPAVIAPERASRAPFLPRFVHSRIAASGPDSPCRRDRAAQACSEVVRLVNRSRPPESPRSSSLVRAPSGPAPPESRGPPLAGRASWWQRPPLMEAGATRAAPAFGNRMARLSARCAGAGVAPVLGHVVLTGVEAELHMAQSVVLVAPEEVFQRAIEEGFLPQVDASLWGPGRSRRSGVAWTHPRTSDSWRC